jgi:predicted ATPase/DNA-binding SARP family transcriptional activator
VLTAPLDVRHSEVTPHTSSGEPSDPTGGDVHAADDGPDAASGALRVDVLGPLRLYVTGRHTEVSGQRRRSLLALLALSAGRVLSTDYLVDALWSEHSPDNAAAALHSHISRLRRDLGPAATRLRRQGAGYALELGPDELDAAVARQLAGSVTTLLGTDPPRAAAVAREALDLWRGQALEEFPEVAPLAADAVGLSELHVRLCDDALEARLLCADRSVTADAAAAADAQPLRERTVTLLMRALAAEGRTAEAMAVASAYRRRLADETGLDPGPGLPSLEREIATGTLLAVPAPAPMRAQTRRRTIVRPSGPMVGRERDAEELHRLLASYPVVTVTGPGGVGKTRLALDVAAALGERDTGDAVLVTLAAIAEARRVPDGVASTLGLRLAGETTPTGVADTLAGEQMLLVLDNCEHVVSACRELVTALRSRAPGVRVLATSRVSLHAPGEFVIRLQPLPLPRDDTDHEGLARQPSVQAFVEHARRRRSGFTLSRTDAGPVVEVIRRLDGLPLAIELAAGQLAVMPVEALRDRLGRALDALSADRPEDDSRHRTLRTTVSWSYRLLAPGERALLRALAPFPGGVDLATVEHLATETVPGTDPLVVLSRLVDASLVAADPTGGRYLLLDTVRTFLLDELEADAERRAAEDRFLAWARQAAHEIGAALSGPDEPAADRRLRADLPNLRAARDLARSRRDLDLSVDITLALDDASVWRGLRELWFWSLGLVDDPELAGHVHEVAVFGSAAEAAWLLGDLERSWQLARHGLELAAAREVPEDQQRRCWGAMGAVALFRGDFAVSTDAYLRSAATYPNPGVLIAAAALGAIYTGDQATAAQLITRAAESIRQQPNGTTSAFLEYVRGELAAGDDPEAAIALYSAAVNEARRCGAGFVEGVAMVGLASVWTRTGDVVAAAEGFRFLLEYWQTTGNRIQFWTTARNVAWLLLEHGYQRTAALLLAAADADESAATLEDGMTERLRCAYSDLEAALGVSALEEIRRDAQTLPPADVVHLARRDLNALVDRAASLPGRSGLPPG